MKWIFMTVFLMQRHNISSQPLADNVRESGQLNFKDCCPCPAWDRTRDITWDTSNVPDCQCRAADSDTASSIFRPTLKAVQTFARPSEGKEEPKPLLNPEIGLAASVLETLREVTDREYEEAVARDVARSALQFMESDTDEVPVSASKNVINASFSPRNNEDIDAIPESSHNYETRCVHPLENENEFEQYRVHPQRKQFKHYLLTKPIVGSHKNILDMDNSPTEIQESIQPTKINLLNDIKFKTNLLKSKLFLNNEGLTQRNEPNIFEKVFYKPVMKLSDLKLSSQLEQLKKSKLFDANDSPSTAETTKDFSFNNNINKYKNVEQTPLRKPSLSRKSDIDEVLSSRTNLPASKRLGQAIKYAETNGVDAKDANVDTTILKPVLPHEECDLKKETTITTERNECATTYNLSSVPEQHSIHILDTIPSPSQLIEEENELTEQNESQSHENCKTDALNINKEQNSESTLVHEVNDNDFKTSNDEIMDDTTNNLSIDENSEEGDKVNPETECLAEDIKSEASGDLKVLSPTAGNAEENYQSTNAEDNYKQAGESEFANENKLSTLPIIPNFRDGIINTLENLKKVNEKWQEKIKLNVQDALHHVNMENNIVMKENENMNPVFTHDTEIPNASNTMASNTPSNTLSTDDLQKMSDSILEYSTKQRNSDPKISFSNVSDPLQQIDSDGAPSESIQCLTPEDYSTKESKDKQIIINFKEATERANESRESNLDTAMAISESADKTGECENVQENSGNLESKSSPVNFEGNEMMVQASESKYRNSGPVIDNSRYSKQSIFQPNDLNNFGNSVLKVNNFFDDVKSKLSDVLSDANENIVSEFLDNRDGNEKNFKQEALDFNLPLLNLKKSTDLLRTAPESIPSDSYKIKTSKSNLNPFSARVAIPKTFDIKPILNLDESVREMRPKLYNPQSESPKTYTSRTNPQNFNSESTVLSPVFRNTLRSSGSKKSISDSLKDRTDAALKNIHKSLGSSLRSVPLDYNRNFDHENLLETMASKRSELNERLQAINLDLNDRLSSLLPTFNSNPLSQSRTTSQSRSNFKSKQGLDNLRRPPSDASSLYKTKLNTQSRKSYESLPSLKYSQKSSNAKDRLSALKSPRLSEQSISKRPTALEAELKSPIVTKSSSTTSKSIKTGLSKDSNRNTMTDNMPPKTLNPGYKTSQIARKAAVIPKILPPSIENRPMSRLKYGEPYILASENMMSRASIDTDSARSGPEVASNDSDTQLVQQTSKQDVARNLALSKLREALKARNRNSNKKDVQKDNLKLIENAASASENVDKVTEGSLKQNVQYKCNMICTKS